MNSRHGLKPLTQKVTCKACPHYWPAPRGDLFVGRCKLSRRWLLAEQRCHSWHIRQEEQRQHLRKELNT